MSDITKIQIPSPTLSSLIHHSLSTATSGLLFGHLTSLPAQGPTDSDPNPTTSLSSALTITAFLSTPFFTPLSDLTIPVGPTTADIVGWFSTRPSSPLRPSMRESAVTHHLSKTNSSTATCFLLLSSFKTANQAVHTHDYRAYLVSGPEIKMRPMSIDVLNVGTKFRGQYSGFVPESSGALFGMVKCNVKRDESEGESMEVENGKDEEVRDGFGAEGLVGEKAEAYTRELEGLYGKMMGKLEGLVRAVEASSAKVQMQESRNAALRRKLAGFD